jgi:plasmid maintenance system antidote protein VapI
MNTLKVERNRFTRICVEITLNQLVVGKVVKIAIQLVKSYDFTSQHMLNVQNRLKNSKIDKIGLKSSKIGKIG